MMSLSDFVLSHQKKIDTSNIQLELKHKHNLTSSFFQ